MRFVRSLTSKRHADIVAIILLLGEIMPTYSCCVLKGLVYVVIISLLGRQLSSYTKYIKLNIHLFYDIRLVSTTKYTFPIYFTSL